MTVLDAKPWEGPKAAAAVVHTFDGPALRVRAVRYGRGQKHVEPSVALGLGDEVVALTPNEARRLVNKLEDAISQAEYWRRQG